MGSSEKGLLPVDGPFGDFSDDDGFRAQALRSATLGMVGEVITELVYSGG